MFTQPNLRNGWLAWLQGYCLVLLLSSTSSLLKGAAPTANSMACPTINTELTVLGSTYCNAVQGTEFPQAQITIKNSQVGLQYQVWSERGGDHEYSETVPGNGGDLTITFPAIPSLYVPDAIEYYIKVYCCIEPYGCAEEILTQRPIVRFLEKVIPPAVNNPYISYGAKATLTASNNSGQPGVKGFRWYAAPNGGTPIATGATFTTPNLTAPKKYYVAAYTDYCESARKEASVCVAPNPNLTVIGSSVCNLEFDTPYPTGTVTIKNSQVGVFYQVWGGRGYYTFFSNKEPGTGGDLTIPVTPTSSAQPPDQFTFDVIAYGCMDGEVTLKQKATIKLLETIWTPTANGVTINSGQTATLTAIPTDQYPAYATGYAWYATGVGGTPLATGLTFTTPALTATTTYYLAATGSGCESGRVPVVVTVNGGYARRINSGGASYTAGGKVFGADASFAGGSVSSIAGGEVANTTNDGLYRTLRVGAFSYNIPSGNGTFDVILHFNETWFGYRTGGGAGSRRFHVDVEGTRRLTNYDIFAKAGGAMRARTEILRVTVADGTLNLGFVKGLADNPAVAAVEVVAVQPPVALRVNAGGNAFSTIDARSFSADAYFSGGSVSTATTLGIGGTADDYLYQTGRHGSSFAYNFPTGNGSFDVVLHFAETYYGNVAPGGAGSRRFHVDMEGVRRLTNYDVFARAGGALKVAQETFRVNVTDGTLNVNFLKGLADNPAVKAIEVLPAGSALAVNSGGSAFTTGAGKVFSSDVYFANGTTSSIAGGEVANTSNDGLYRTLRTGASFSYGLPTGNGTFDVTLHFNETWFGHRSGGGAGSRRFHMDAEGVRRLTNYDIFAEAGGAMRAVQYSIRVEVTDGTLNLFFYKGLADNPAVAAIEVVPVTVTGAREAAEVKAAGDAEDVQVDLYPNPARDNLTVKLPFPARQVTGTAVVTPTGEGLLQDGHRVKGEYELEIPVGHLKSGLYLLQLRSGHGQQVVRFVKGN